MSRIFLACILLILSTSQVLAVSDPQNSPNNRVGVHILDPKEIIEAAKLVNSNGGDWGYVTIPIRSDDRDRIKWDFFFRSCTTLHLIPIIRLASYFDGSAWTTPTAYDLVDFANFLSDLPWPIRNRYLVIYNEPNHGGEWGGKVDPAYYATLLIQANYIFKSRSQDFFILSAGLDMSAPSNYSSLDALQFYRAMTKAQPNWYSAIDGLSVHAYPNPNFSSSMTSLTRYGPKSYLYEVQLLKSLGFPPKPIFITETGNTSGNDIYSLGFSQIWTEPDIIAVTPFLLFAGTGSFSSFSLLDLSHQPKKSYQALQKLSKIAGSPQLNPIITLPALAIVKSTTALVPSAPDFFDLLRRLLTPSLPQLFIISAGTKTTLSVEVMKTANDLSRGLSGYSSLPADHGMLFVFSRPQILKFWMKEMNFPLDFIWIRNNTIVGLTENIQPPIKTNGQPQTLNSPVLSDQVLEDNAGYISTHQIAIGDKVSL